MRPSICRVISDGFYNGRLTAHESAADHSLNLQDVDLSNEGIVMIPLESRRLLSKEGGRK